jgi:hypothetical protein
MKINKVVMNFFMYPPIITLICRDRTTISITPAIKEQVHKLAESQNIPSGITIHSRIGQLLYDNALDCRSGL